MAEREFMSDFDQKKILHITSVGQHCVFIVGISKENSDIMALHCFSRLPQFSYSHVKPHLNWCKNPFARHSFNYTFWYDLSSLQCVCFYVYRCRIACMNIRNQFIITKLCFHDMITRFRTCMQSANIWSTPKGSDQPCPWLWPSTGKISNKPRPLLCIIPSKFKIDL